MNKPLSVTQRRKMRDYIKRVARERAKPELLEFRPTRDEDLLGLFLVSVFQNQVKADEKLLELLRDDLRLDHNDCICALTELAIIAGETGPMPIVVIRDSAPINGVN